jgi:hypothetical protein
VIARSAAFWVLIGRRIEKFYWLNDNLVFGKPFFQKEAGHSWLSRRPPPHIYGDCSDLQVRNHSLRQERLRRRHKRRRDRNWSDIRRLRRASSSISISMAIEANRYVPPIIRRTSSAEIVDGSLLGALGMEEQPIMIPVAASAQIAR